MNSSGEHPSFNEAPAASPGRVRRESHGPSFLSGSPVRLGDLRRDGSQGARRADSDHSRACDRSAQIDPASPAPSPPARSLKGHEERFPPTRQCPFDPSTDRRAAVRPPESHVPARRECRCAGHS
jgi:hypothetical protein